MAIRVPGIIVRIVNDTGGIAPPTYERYPVIIGVGDPYRLVSNEKVLRGAGDIDALDTIFTVNMISSVGDLPGVSKYVSGVDYNLVGDTVSWLGASSQPDADDYYYVTYTDTRAASAYVPTLYFDETLVYTDHGSKSRTDGTINDVSVGAFVSLGAGAAGVVVVQLDTRSSVDPMAPTAGELETLFTNVITELEKITDYKLFLVPMSSGTLTTTSAATLMFNHAVVASEPENKQERTVIGSLPKDTTYSGAATFAQTYTHERMVVPAVKKCSTYVTGFSDLYDMRFYSAALAGKLCSVPIGINITDETIPNITCNDNFSPAELKYLVQRGVSPGKIAGDVMRNVMSITTNPSSALTEDLGVQDVKDYVKKYWRERLWDIFKNIPVTGLMPTSVRRSSVSILESLVRRSIVADFNTIAVTQDPDEPRRLLVTGKIKPAYGLQWMDVTFTFVLGF